MILGEGMGLLNNTQYLKGDTLLAYLLGTTFGLFIMKGFGKNTLLERFPKHSAISAATSLALLILLLNAHDSIINGSMISYLFFFVLVFRFCFWFLARIVRVDIAAGIGRNLAWTEFSYYVGVIVGLLLWQSGWMSISIIQLLCVDIVSQILAAFLDNYSFQRLKAFMERSAMVISKSKVPLGIFVGIASFVVCLTVATQIVEFGFAIFSIEFFKNGKSFAANIVAAGYIGAAIGAWLLGKINLDYDEQKTFLGTGAVTVSSYSVPIFYACVECFVLLCLAFMIPFSSLKFSRIISLVLFAASALVYDVIVLVILDKLGRAAKSVGDVGSVADVYAYMGAIGTFCMFAFVHVLQDKYSFVIASAVFFVVAYLFLASIHKKQVLTIQ